RFYTSAGNPVKEILLKLNLPDHRLILTDWKIEVKLKNLKKDAILKLFKITDQERYEHVGPEVTSSQDGKVYKMANRDKQHGRLSYKGVLTFEFACICRNHQESSSSSHGNIDRVNSITKVMPHADVQYCLHALARRLLLILWPYASLMPPIISLSLSMACDDSDGCVTMAIGL
ncbi:hypothetical protein Tco_1128620, partial [Tanacetum coccineum]